MSLSNSYQKKVEVGETYEAHRGGKVIATALVLPGTGVLITRKAGDMPYLSYRDSKCTVYDLKKMLCSRLSFATEGLGFRVIELKPADTAGKIGGCVNNYSIERSHHLEVLRQRDEFKAECEALRIVIKDLRAAGGDKEAYRCPVDGQFILWDANRGFTPFAKGFTFDQAKAQAEAISNRNKRRTAVFRMMFDVKVEKKTTYNVTSEEV